MTATDRAPARSWAWLRHRDLAMSSGTLFGTTVVTSALGFVYWSLIARSATPEAVGAASSTISALTLLGSVGVFGFGTMLIGELARTPERANDLLPASVTTSAALSVMLAAGFVAVSHVTGSGLRSSLDSWTELGLFIGGVALTAVTFLLDQACIGLAMGPVQLWRNSFFAAAKVLLIPLVALTARQNEAILGTWVVALAASAVLVLWQLRRRDITAVGRPRIASLTGLGWVTFHHNVINLALTIPRMAVPVVVGAFVPGRRTAAFYAAWMIAGFLYMIPTHLSTSLFAIGAGNLRALRSKMRVTLGVSAAVGLVAVPAVALLAKPLMMIFGDTYAADGAGCLVVLALLYLPHVVKQHYAAVLRMLDRVRDAGVATAVAAGAELLAVVVGARTGSITRTVELQGAVLLVEMVLMAPPVLRALRTPAAPATVAVPSSRHQA